MKAFDPLQITFDDLFSVRSDDMTEQSLIERQLKRGSGFVGGKERILAKFAEHPSIKEFAAFLCNEYGIGGFGDKKEDQHHNGKGIRMMWKEKGNEIDVSLTWDQVAEQISKLILRGEYEI